MGVISFRRGVVLDQLRYFAHQTAIVQVGERSTRKPLAIAPRRIIPAREDRKVFQAVSVRQRRCEGLLKVLTQLSVQRSCAPSLGGEVEGKRFLPIAGEHGPEAEFPWLNSPCERYSIKVRDLRDHFRTERRGFTHFFDPLMVFRRKLKIHLSRGPVARR